MSAEKVTEEIAKAAQALAPVIDKNVDRIGAFLHTVIGAGVEHLGQAFSNWAAVFQYKNALRLIDQVETIHRERGLAGKTVPIPPRLGVPLLQQATLEDDEKLLEMWAALVPLHSDYDSLSG
jgi:hypothetical protein